MKSRLSMVRPSASAMVLAWASPLTARAWVALVMPATGMPEARLTRMETRSGSMDAGMVRPATSGYFGTGPSCHTPGGDGGETWGGGASLCGVGESTAATGGHSALGAGM